MLDIADIKYSRPPRADLGGLGAGDDDVYLEVLIVYPSVRLYFQA